ncbi:MAG: O-antigen ligase family protein [Candidatus Schekmanbacteria bacterium]|nr:O-antigen ligase family protein [Candidatus Schekmanbacteria bacterium]
MTLYFFDPILVAKKIFSASTFGISIPAGWFQPSGWPRPASGIQDHHETALLMNLVFAMAIGLFMVEKSRFRKGLLIGIMSLSTFIVFQTESRAGFGGLFIMSFYLFSGLNKLRKVFLPLFICFFAGSLVVYISSRHIVWNVFLKKDFGTRLLHIAGKVVESGGVIEPGLSKSKPGRKKLWEKAFKLYGHSIIQGLGIGNLTYYTTSPHAHSIYFSLLFDFGLIGVLCLLYIVVYLYKCFSGIKKFQASYLQVMGVAIWGGFLALAFHGLVDFDYNRSIVWLYLGTAVATLNLVKQELKK